MTSYERAQKVAENYSKSLRADDLRFSHTVRVIHADRTVMSFEHAFLMKWNEKEVKPGKGLDRFPGQWLLIFTEHHGVLVYRLDDLLAWNEYVRAPTIEWLGEPPDEKE